jgi:hypothetical protein
MEDAYTNTRATQILAEVDEAMWLRAREGDVAAAKVVYARLAQILPPTPPTLPPTWAEVQQLFQQVQAQLKGLTDDTARVLADIAKLDSDQAG